MTVLDIVNLVYTSEETQQKCMCLYMYSPFYETDVTSQFVAMFCLADRYHLLEAERLARRELSGFDSAKAFQDIVRVKQWLSMQLQQASTTIAQELSFGSFPYTASMRNNAFALYKMMNISFKDFKKYVFTLPYVYSRNGVVFYRSEKEKPYFNYLDWNKNEFRDTGLFLTYENKNTVINAKLLLGAWRDNAYLLFPSRMRITTSSSIPELAELSNTYCYLQGTQLRDCLLVEGLVKAPRRLLRNMRTVSLQDWRITDYDTSIVRGVSKMLINADMSNFASQGSNVINMDYLSKFVAWRCAGDKV